MQIVKFQNGNYGIKKGWLFPSYQDLVCLRYTWKKGELFFRDCQGNFATVSKVYGRLTGKLMAEDKVKND